MEDFVDKNDVEMDVLGDNVSLQSRQRFPKDEAVLARFGKKQQFRVSSFPYASFSQLHKQRQLQLSLGHFATDSMSFIARVRTPTSGGPYQYSHDNMGSHHIVSRPPFQYDAIANGLTEIYLV